MKIRPYQDKDEADVIRLWETCGLIASQKNPSRDIARKLKVNSEWFLVLERDSELIATCMAGFEGHRGWINYLAVRPTEQRKGFAKKILAEAEQLLRNAGCPKINLQIRATNQKVIKFYQSIGFSIDDVVSLGKRLETD